MTDAERMTPRDRVSGGPGGSGGRGVRQDEPPRRRRFRGLPGFLAVIVALAVVGGGFYFVVTRGVDLLMAQFAGAEDFEGPGRGKVTFEVLDGDSAAAIGRNLKAAGVVASVDAFLMAAEDDPASRGIQVGFYQMRKEMKAADALAILVDENNLLKNTVTIPEGLRVVDIVALLAERTDFEEGEFERVLNRPKRLGLPRYAGGKPEGYLFPATYDFGPNATPESMLKAMVARWEQAAKSNGLERAARDLGYSPHELMTVASLVQSEALPDDMTKVARVIYNRLEEQGETNYLLQLDATVNYAHGENLGATTTEEERSIDSPYNTYRVTGLPPGPISAPGDEAIGAAGNPAAGDWFFYVTVNLATGETRFAKTLAQHSRNVELLREYCREESERC